MHKRFERLLYFFSLISMLLRGTVYQLLRFKFRGWLLLGSGARVLGLRNLRVNGIWKIGSHALLDARFSEGVVVGNRFSLGDFSILRASGSINFVSRKVLIGDGVSFGPYCNIGGGFGLEIGNDCIFGPYVSIHPEGHDFSAHDVLIKDQGVSGRGVHIGKNCWVAAKVTVLDGAIVEPGCVLGAGSILVSGVYPSDYVYAGVPAKAIKSRLKNAA